MHRRFDKFDGIAPGHPLAAKMDQQMADTRELVKSIPPDDVMLILTEGIDAMDAIRRSAMSSKARFTDERVSLSSAGGWVLMHLALYGYNVLMEAEHHAMAAGNHADRG